MVIFCLVVLERCVCVCVCACVCVTLCSKETKEVPAGGPSMCCARWSNEAATTHADITADHRDAPAFLHCVTKIDYSPTSDSGCLGAQAVHAC